MLLSLQARQKNSQAQLFKSKRQLSHLLLKAYPHTRAQPCQSFIQTRTQSWQAHMQRISPFLVCGENVWWTQTEDKSSYKSDHEEYRPAGPSLLHFSTHTIPDDSIMLPAPFIRLYDQDGN